MEEQKRQDLPDGAGTGEAETAAPEPDNSNARTKQSEGAAEDKAVQDPAAGKAEKKEVKGNAITRMYDKVPLSLKQVDIIVKVLAVVLVLVMVYGYLTGGSSPLK